MLKRPSTIGEALTAFHVNQGWKKIVTAVTLSIGSARVTSVMPMMHNGYLAPVSLAIFRQMRELCSGDELNLVIAPKMCDPMWGTAQLCEMTTPYTAQPFRLECGLVDFNVFRKQKMTRGKPYLWQPISWLTIPIERGERGAGFCMVGPAVIDMSPYLEGPAPIYDETTPWLRDVAPRPKYVSTPIAKTPDDVLGELQRLSFADGVEVQQPVLWRVDEEFLCRPLGNA